MTDSIPLHPELGVNPRMIKVNCFACGQLKDDSIALLGKNNYIDTCPNCNADIYGGVKSEKWLYTCPKCNHVSPKKFGRRELTEWEEIALNGICQECEGYMELGVILISVRDGEDGKNPYRTGGWVVLKDEAVKRMCNCEKQAEEILNKRLCFIPDEAWEMLGLPKEKSCEEESENA